MGWLSPITLRRTVASRHFFVVTCRQKADITTDVDATLDH